jgi:hypothetical protein
MRAAETAKKEQEWKVAMPAKKRKSRKKIQMPD